MMEPPVQPNESDCCNSGCNPCILDVYESQLRKYKEYLKNVNSFEVQAVNVINAIDPISYTIYKLDQKIEISNNVYLFKFLYSDNKKSPNCLKYKSGQYFLLKAKNCNNDEFTRAYTPIPLEIEDSNLSFTVLIRLYENGEMSRFLQKLKIGHDTLWRGPYGDFAINYNYKYLFFIAQGTGLAPIFAVIDEIIHDEDSEIFIKLFFCCRDIDDILLRDKLYEFGSYWNFTYEIFLSNNNNVTRKYNEIIHENKLGFENIKSYVNTKIGKLQAIICGSNNFSESIKVHFLNSGVKINDIYVF